MVQLALELRRKRGAGVIGAFIKNRRPMNNLRVLPKVRDSLSYLYVEHCRIDQEAKQLPSTTSRENFRSRAHR